MDGIDISGNRTGVGCWKLSSTRVLRTAFIKVSLEARGDVAMWPRLGRAQIHMEVRTRLTHRKLLNEI